MVGRFGVLVTFSCHFKKEKKTLSSALAVVSGVWILFIPKCLIRVCDFPEGPETVSSTRPILRDVLETCFLVSGKLLVPYLSHFELSCFSSTRFSNLLERAVPKVFVFVWEFVGNYLSFSVRPEKARQTQHQTGTDDAGSRGIRGATR